MKKFWEDFKKFIKRGNVVDMAVGVAVASAFTAIVTAFTKGFINPLLALISKSSDQEALKIILRPEVLDASGEVVQTEVALLWGPFVQAIINFIIVAFTLFLVIKIVSAVASRSAKIRQGVQDLLTDSDEKRAEAEAAAKAQEEEAARAAEEKARIEAEEAAKAEALAKAKLEEEENRKKREEALLVEICGLLKELNKK